MRTTEVDGQARCLQQLQEWPHQRMLNDALQASGVSVLVGADGGDGRNVFLSRELSRECVMREEGTMETSVDACVSGEQITTLELPPQLSLRRSGAQPIGTLEQMQKNPNAG